LQHVENFIKEAIDKTKLDLPQGVMPLNRFRDIGGSGPG